MSGFWAWLVVGLITGFLMMTLGRAGRSHLRTRRVEDDYPSAPPRLARWAITLVVLWLVAQTLGHVALRLGGLDAWAAATAAGILVDGGVALLMLRWFRRQRFLARYVGISPFRWKANVIAGLQIGLVTSIVNLAGAKFMSAVGMRIDRAESLEGWVWASSSLGELLVVALLAVVLAPLVEELLFRGLLYTGLRNHTGPWHAAAVTAFVFAALHGTAARFPALFLFAMAWARARERGHSLVGPAVAHACLNASLVAGAWNEGALMSHLSFTGLGVLIAAMLALFGLLSAMARRLPVALPDDEDGPPRCPACGALGDAFESPDRCRNCAMSWGDGRRSAAAWRVLGALAMGAASLTALTLGSPWARSWSWPGRVQAQILLFNGHTDRAAAVLERLLETRSDDGELHLDRAGILYVAGRFRDAAEACRRALATGRVSRIRYCNLAALSIAESGGDLDEALALAEEALKLAPADDRAGVLDTLGWVRFKRGEWDEADRLLQKAWHGMNGTVPVASAEMDVHMASVAWKKGRLDEARRLFRRALAVQGGETVFHRRAREALVHLAAAPDELSPPRDSPPARDPRSRR